MTRIEAFKWICTCVLNLIYRADLDYKECINDLKECFKVVGITEEEYKEVFSYEHD